MTKDLSIGFQNYNTLKDYIVDKTLMIQEFLDMAIDSIELFKDTQIMKAKYIYQINQYPNNISLNSTILYRIITLLNM